MSDYNQAVEVLFDEAIKDSSDQFKSETTNNKTKRILGKLGRLILSTAVTGALTVVYEPVILESVAEKNNLIGAIPIEIPENGYLSLAIGMTTMSVLDNFNSRLNSDEHYRQRARKRIQQQPA